MFNTLKITFLKGLPNFFKAGPLKIKLTVKNLYPNTLMIPAPMPTATAPPAPICILQTDPTATPPASVEFWMWTMSNRPPCLLTADERKKVVTCVE